MASVNRTFEVTTRSGKQAAALIEAVQERAANREPLTVESAEVAGTRAVIELGLSYATAAVGPGHLVREIENTVKKTEGVEVRKVVLREAE